MTPAERQRRRLERQRQYLGRRPVGEYIVDDEQIDPLFDKADDNEIEAISAEMGVTGARRPAAE